jgi:hypothetical protein
MREAGKSRSSALTDIASTWHDPIDPEKPEANVSPLLKFHAGWRFCRSSLLFRVCAAIALIGFSGVTAEAQMTDDQPGQPGLSQHLLPAATTQLAQAPAAQPAPSPASFAEVEVLTTPYFWMPWTSVGVTPSNTRIPSASGTVDFGQLFTHLTWVPFMGEVEFRDDSFGVITDYLHAPLRAGIDTHNILFSGATGGLGIDTGTAMFLYRPFASPDQYIDVGMGVRAWGLSGGITLNEGLLPSFTATRGTAWADPLIGARYHHNLGNGFGATAYGDVGGFGVGAHVDWQVLGTIDYAFRDWIDLHAGFREMGFSYSLPRSNLDVNMYGPILAATFRF